ncbi:MAG: hypothetical protein PHY42_04415 [Bacilli bacterium]|nr:hypothetical protein [Bacilli bacterium]
MRKFWILCKVNLLNTFGLNRLKKKFGNKSGFLRLGMPILTVFLGLLFLGFSFFYIALYSQIFVMAEQYEGILYLGFGLGGLMMLLTTITKANSYLFESKDYDMLMTLPVPTRTIVASKITQLSILNYFMLLYFAIPSVVLYGIYTSPSIFFYLGALGVYLLFPFLIMTICSAISYGINLLLGRMKRKNVVQVIFMIVFFVLIMVGSMSLSSSMSAIEGDDVEAIIQMATNIQTVMKYLYYPSVFMVEGLLGSITHYLLYVVISVLPFIGFIYAVGKGFTKAQSRAKMTYTNQNFVLKEEKATSPVMAVFKKEVKLLFSNANVFMNTAIAPIMSTFMLVFYIITQKELFTELGSIMNSDMMIAVLIALVTFMGTIITTTASSISLEGKQFWIVKVAPIEPMAIFKAKILVNFVLTVPTMLINAIVVAIVFKPGFVNLVFFIILPLLVNLLMGALGLMINLCFPKLDWDNPLKAVKQGMSVVLTMFISMILMVILGVFFVFISPFLGAQLTFLALIVLLGLALLGMYYLLKSAGVKRYHAIQA